MASVSSTRSSDSYDVERAQVQDYHERDLDKLKSDEEKTLTAAKEEYQNRLKDLKDEANQEIRRLKEDSYDSQGRRLTNLERDNLNEKKRITEAYQSELSKEQDHGLERDRLYESKVRDALNTANEQNLSKIKTQKAEYIQLAEDQKAESSRAKKYFESELTQEKNKDKKNSEQLIQVSDKNQERALSERSQKYDDYIKENHKNTQFALQEKDQEIAELKNNTDPNKVSPEARKKVEEAYRQRFNRDLNEEKRINVANTESLKSGNANYEQSLRDSYSEKFNEMSKDLRSRYVAEKGAIARSYQDLESQSDVNQKYLVDRQVDQSQRTYQKNATELSLQNERNQERLKDQRESLIEDKYKAKEEFETKQKTQEREWGYKLTDTRREYEKKILDQKDLHEKEMEQVKFDFDKKLQEQQRTSKRLLEDRIKAYEAQLSTQESMHKEQGRLLTEHYDEELDKMKRTNARITQAKS